MEKNFLRFNLSRKLNTQKLLFRQILQGLEKFRSFSFIFIFLFTMIKQAIGQPIIHLAKLTLGRPIAVPLKTL